MSPRIPALGFLLVFSLLLQAEAQPKRIKKSVAYRTVGDHKIMADVFRPVGDDKVPVLVWIHGGALIMGHRGGIHPRVTLLASQNPVALVSLDYRLAPETKLPAIISDIEAAFRWLAEEGAREFNLDPERIVVVGGSAGGYLALTTGYRVHPRPAAIVALYGYGRLTSSWYTSPSPHPRHNPRAISAEVAADQTDGTVVSDARQRKGNGGLIYLHYRQTGKWPAEVSGFDARNLSTAIAPFEPARHVSDLFPPTLMLHGTVDTDVPFEESEEMAKQFSKHSVPHRLRPLVNAEHGFGGSDPADLEEAYQEMDAFIKQHLKL